MLLFLPFHISSLILFAFYFSLSLKQPPSVPARARWHAARDARSVRYGAAIGAVAPALSAASALCRRNKMLAARI